MQKRYYYLVMNSCLVVITYSNSCAHKNGSYYYVLIEKWGEELQIIRILLQENSWTFRVKSIGEKI